MAFICNDCSYRSAEKFSGGKCPACDSFNIKADHKTVPKRSNKRQRTTIEFVILIVVWLALAYGVWDRYIKAPKAINEKPVIEKTVPIYDGMD